jgi:hypothetical protein
MKKVIVLILLCSAVLYTSCNNSVDTDIPDDPYSKYSNSIVLEWNLNALEAMGGPVYPLPLLNSRINTMMHIAIHDAINSIEPKYQTYIYNGIHADANPIAAAAIAAHTVLEKHFPEQKELLDERLSESLADIDNGASKTAGIEAGLAAGNAILELRAEDGAFENPIGTTEPSEEPGVYQMVPPFDFVYGEFWAGMEPFGLHSPEQFRSIPHPALDSQKYADDFNEVKLIGELNSQQKSEDQVFVGKFWYELSEIGWNRIARIVSNEQELDLHSTARLFALLNIALGDSYIAGFESKYYYNFWRPYTAIRGAGLDGNSLTEPDQEWEPAEPTPPVPDYPSTHSALGNAAAKVLASILGDNTGFTVESTTGVPADQPRSFSSFSEAADENADSRVLAGLHFRFACDAGQQLGDDVADWVIANHLKPLD